MTESIKIESDNKTEVQKFFDCVLKIMNGVGISAVFSQDICFGRTEEDARFYDISDDVIILFENGMCLDLNYRFIDSFGAELREMTGEEKKLYDENQITDFFNNTVFENTPDEETVSLEYDSLDRIDLKSVTKPYSKWIRNEIVDEIEPDENTFEDITFTMKNGKVFSVHPCDAMDDGYTLVWSDDAEY